MIPALREDFNRRFTPARYHELVGRLNQRTHTQIQFPVCETPVFLPAALVQQMADAGAEMTHQLVGNAEYLRLAAGTIPPEYRVAGQDAHPNFMTVDFGLIRLQDGSLQPRLVELQAFPSIYGFQAVLAQEYGRVYQLDPALRCFMGELDETSYWERLRQVVVGNHAPEHVVLMEVAPEQQKTLPDFRVHEDRLGIRTVDITAVRQRGRRLFYEHGGRWVPIERIYNRAIVDEFVRKQIEPGFGYTADLDVEWAGHPNWYFLLSKFSIPYLRHPLVPPSVFLDEWMRGERPEGFPEDRARWVLKPLFSFAGKGIEFAPTDDLLRSIPEDRRSQYLLQERLAFAPVIETPFGPTQAEVRVLYLWPDHGDLQPVITLVRLGRGAMMGVDHNRNQQWVGGSAALIAR